LKIRIVAEKHPSEHRHGKSQCEEHSPDRDPIAVTGKPFSKENIDQKGQQGEEKNE
jgi:hypothetical protein